MENINYVQEVLDSHFWTDLNQMITFLENLKYCGSGFNLLLSGQSLEEYMLIGIRNTIANGYKLTRDSVKLSTLTEGAKFKFNYDLNHLAGISKDDEFFLLEKNPTSCSIWDDTKKRKYLVTIDYDVILEK